MKCRICQGSITPILELGEHPLANNFVGGEITPHEFPLEYGVCTSCTAFQSMEVPPGFEFEQDYINYHYVPYGSTLQQHYSDLARDVINYGLTDGSKVTHAIDIGSNDGTFLKALQMHTSLAATGVEPSEEISRMAQKTGIHTINKFFDASVAEEIVNTRGLADIVSATQVLQHVYDPVAFMNGVTRVMRDDGMFVYEGRYLGSTLDLSSYDSLYHEIIILYSFQALKTLFGVVGLQPVHVEQTKIYGGSLRVFARKKRVPLYQPSSSVQSFKEPGINPLDLIWFRSFARASRLRIRRLKKMINKLHEDGKTIAGYGASSTGNTILNACGFSNAELGYIIDESPLKQGLFTPGSKIPIVSLDHLTIPNPQPDYILLLAWRLKDEIVEKIPQYKGRIICPLPEVKVI